MASYLNKIVIILFLLEMSSGQTSELFISEYGEGSGHNKYIEIFNGTGGSVDLSNYRIIALINGGAWSSPGHIIGLTDTIVNNDVYVIANSRSEVSATIKNAADLLTGSVSFNGNDALALQRTTDGGSTWSNIDLVGDEGADPGTGWAVAGTSDATCDHTLVRKSIISSPQTNWSSSAGTTASNSEWTVYAIDTWDYIGSHSADASLPVELTAFTAYLEQNNAVLRWTTESEIENLGFILERRTANCENWCEIASYITNPDLRGQGNSTQRTEYNYLDKTVAPGNRYEFRLADVGYDGSARFHQTTVLAIDDGISVPERMRLEPAYPNPFNPSTTLTFVLIETGPVRLSIYDITGREVTTLVDGFKADGEYQIKWNAGSQASGIYFCQLRQGGRRTVQKLVLAR